MGLKQSIVIKSEYTNNARSKPGGGSRGASPGQYVLRYMAREDATEVLAPVALYDAETFTRYMARASATEALKEERGQAFGAGVALKAAFRDLDMQAGRAFGTDSLSLSQEALMRASETVQSAFDEGHSVQKVVLSFTEDYLRETGVLDRDFVHRGRGSYKGHVDQLKLRGAIREGVEAMTTVGKFADPYFVGTIQFDTSHVHAHLAIVDRQFADARMKPDGADRGKINELEKKTLRKGINRSLEDMATLRSFSGQASLERQNVVAFVKDYAYTALAENTQVQLLVASLPEDERQWRYKSNSKAMQKPNALATGIVESVFEADPVGSGYDDAMDAVRRYAAESRLRDRLDEDEEEALIKTGRARIVERSVNGLYATLKDLAPEDRPVRTVMTDIQSSSDAELTAAVAVEKSDAAAFALRLRGYSGRRTQHEADVKTFRTLATGFDAADDAGLVDPSANVMRLFYEEELRYHMQCADKYRYFLGFDAARDADAVEKMTPRYEALAAAFDPNADEGGVRSYTQALATYTLDCYEEGVASFKEWDAIMAYDGASVAPRHVAPIRPKTKAENLTATYFEHVKAKDIHHLGFDYLNKETVTVGAQAARDFADTYAARLSLATAAKDYAAQTNQTLAALDAATADIDDMVPVVDKAVADGVLVAARLPDVPGERRQKQTIRVDRTVDVAKHLEIALRDADVGAELDR